MIFDLAMDEDNDFFLSRLKTFYIYQSSLSPLFYALKFKELS